MRTGEPGSPASAPVSRQSAKARAHAARSHSTAVRVERSGTWRPYGGAGWPWVASVTFQTRAVHLTSAWVERFSAVLGGEEGQRPTIVLPFDARERYGRARAPVRGTVNGAAFRTTVAVYSGVHLIGFNKEVRARAGSRSATRSSSSSSETTSRARSTPHRSWSRPWPRAPRREPRTRSSPTPTAASTRSGSRAQSARRRASAARPERSGCSRPASATPRRASPCLSEPRNRSAPRAPPRSSPSARHPRRAGAALAELDERVNVVRRALEDSLDGPVASVCHPARQPAAARLAPGAVAKEDPLNAPVHHYAPADRLAHRIGPTARTGDMGHAS